jgi:hypothetical protein
MLFIKSPVTPIFLAILFMLLIFSGLPGTSISADEAIKQQENTYANAEITIKILPSANRTFGYEHSLAWEAVGASADNTGIAGE